MISSIINTVRQSNKIYPEIYTLFSARSRWVSAIPDIKSYDYFLNTLKHMVHMVYDGYMGGDFIDVMASLVQGQLTRAYQEAVIESGMEVDEMTPEMIKELETFILSEYDYVDKFYRDIVDARIEGIPVDQMIERAKLWANRYNDVKNSAKITIERTKGGKLMWRLGATEQHCTTCAQLNGIVAFAKEWEEAGFRPQNPPNPLLECEGWRCDCELTVTNKRRSPKALSRLFDIAIARNV